LKNDKKVLTKNNSSNIMLISEEKNKCIWRERKDENINRSIISKLMAIITILETRFRHICIIVYNTNNMDNNKIIKRKYKKQKSIININSDYSIIKYIFYI
jgi:SpoVK/Ycf46/Vps4 family AAA+-type ATPase